jgi:hypothetical protein
MPRRSPRQARRGDRTATALAIHRVAGTGESVQQQGPAESGGHDRVDLGDEGSLLLGELRAPPVAVQAEEAPAAAVGDERGAQLVADTTWTEQLTEARAGLGVPVGRLAQDPDRSTPGVWWTPLTSAGSFSPTTTKITPATCGRSRTPAPTRPW